MAYFKVLTQHLQGWTTDMDENLSKDKHLASELKGEPGTSDYKARVLTT
jgi:hypothetical protein